MTRTETDVAGTFSVTAISDDSFHQDHAIFLFLPLRLCAFA